MLFSRQKLESDHMHPFSIRASVLPGYRDTLIFSQIGTIWYTTIHSFQAITIVTWILNYAFLTQLPFEMMALEFVNELCGNFVVYYLAVYSYIADVTTDRERTAR